MGERNQEEGLLSTWAGSQQKVLAGWLDLVQAIERPSRAMTWHETVKAWQTAVQETLAAQARWLRDWTGRVQVTSGSPTELRKNVQEAQLLLLRWTEAQQHLWQGGFISCSRSGRSWKLTLRLTSTCSPGCRKADRQSSMHKRSGCGAGRQTCSIDKEDSVWCLREYTLFRLLLGESARVASLPGFYSNVVVKGPSMRRKPP